MSSSNRPPVRLLYLTPTAAMGGAERVLLDVLAMMRRAKPSWSIGLIVGNDGPLVEEARALGVETTVLPFPREFARLGDTNLGSVMSWLRFIRRGTIAAVALTAYIRRLSQAIARFSPDVLHSNGFKMHLLSAVAARPAGASLVWHFHDYLSSRRVTGRLVRLLKSRCQAAVAVSHNVAADLRQVLGEAPSVTPIWNAVDLERFTPDGSTLDLDALAGLPPAEAGTLRVGLVATFARWKGHALFLRALAPIVRERRVRAYIIGGPLYETDGSQISVPELKDTVRRLGIEDHVGLTGFVHDSAAALRSLDVLVHASTAPEPFGLVVAEAMACGRAVVLSNAGGVAELVQPEMDALVYPSGDAASLSQQVARLVSDDVLRRRLGAAARVAAQRQFTGASMQAHLLALYDSLLPGRERSTATPGAPVGSVA